MARTDALLVWPILDAALRESGLPRVLRSDNGPPFASTGAGGLSRLAVLALKAGVRPERIAPGKPQQNGRHERLHLTLLHDTARPPAASLRQQQRRFQAFQRTDNEERPHQALGQTPPAAHYSVSPRRWDGVLREPAYSAEHAVRRVRRNGEIKWRGSSLYVHEALAGEPVGLLETAAGDVVVSYGPLELGVIDPRGDRLRRPHRRSGGFGDDPTGSPPTPPAPPPQPLQSP